MSQAEAKTTPVAIAPRADFAAWWMLAVLFGLYVFSFVDRYITTMLVPHIQASLDVSEFQMGLILGPAFAIFYSVFGIPLGWAADRYDRRWVIFIGACCFGLATIMSGLATSFVMLLIARIAVGIGEASLSPAANSLLASRFPRHMLTTVLSIYTMGVKVGSAGAFILGGLLIAAAGVWVVTYDALAGFEPWQIVFMATGLPAVLLALLVFTFKEPPRPAKKKAGVKPAAIIPFMRERKRLFIPMLIGFSLIALCTYSLTGWVPTYLHRHFGMEPVVYGPILGLISTIAAFTLAFKGMFVDWLYRRGMKDAHIRFYTWLLIGSLPVVFALFWVQQPVIFMIMYGALQVVSIPIMAYVSAAMQLIAPTELRGRITGVFLFCLNGVGGGLGPVIVGSLTEYVFRDEMKVGWSLAVLICTAIPLALVLLRLALKPLRAAIVEAEEREAAELAMLQAAEAGQPGAS